MAFSKGAVIGHETIAVIITESKLVNNMVERGPGGLLSLTDGSKAILLREANCPILLTHEFFCN